MTDHNQVNQVNQVNQAHFATLAPLFEGLEYRPSPSWLSQSSVNCSIVYTF